MSQRILFVDDDANLLAALQRNLRKQFTFDTALGGQEGLRQIETHGPYAVVVADMQMPGMNGIEFLEQVRTRSPDSIRLMLTGNADQQTAVEAVNRGQVFRFLNKPCPQDVLVPAIEGGLRVYDLHRVERELLEGTLTGSVKMLTDVLGMIAPESLGRGQRLRDSIKLVAWIAGATRTWDLEMAALLSSIGNAALPPHVFRKVLSGMDLTAEEREISRRTPQVGHDLLTDIPRLQEVARIVLYQHQHFDGSGFPGDGVSGEALPLGARLLKILSDRLILEGDGVVKKAAHEMMKGREGFYDPRLLDLVFTRFPDFLAQSLSSTLPVLSLPIAQLKSGQIVVSDILTKEGLLLVAAGNRLTGMMLKRLHNYAEIGDVEDSILVQDPTAAEGEKPADPLHDPIPFEAILRN